MKKFLATLLIAASSMAAIARTVTVMPGTLAETLAETPDGTASDSYLTLEGAIDARDFEELRSLRGVEILDLSRCRIEEYSSREPIFPGAAYFPANTLTSHSLFGIQVRGLILPATLTGIEEGAMAGSGLREITIPAGVKTIGADAFYDSQQLRSVTLPSGLMSLGVRALASCPLLESLNLEATSVTELPERCLAGTASLRRLDTGKIRKIGSEAFAGSGIEYLSIPLARELKPYALAGMSRLKGVSLNADAIISEGTLFGDAGVTEIKGMPDIIPDLFAANCRSFSFSADGGAGTFGIGRHAFANTGTSTMILGREVSHIGADAFALCTSLSEIDATALVSFTPDVSPSAFDGINTPDVRLLVADGCVNVWKNHPVWGTFNVIDSTTGVDAPSILPDENRIKITLGPAAIEARLEDENPGSGGEITLSVYTTDGSRVARRTGSGGDVAIDTGSLPRGILLVTATSPGIPAARIKVVL